VPILVPPLRDRKEDVPFLARQFMQRFARKHGVRVRGISDEGLAALSAHRWPGNVRELQNVIERAVILCGDNGLLELEHFGLSASPSIPAAASVAASSVPASGPSASPAGVPAAASAELVSLAEVEKRHIFSALEKTGQNRTHAAKLLGISVRTLRNKLSEYGVQGKDETAGENE